MRHKLCAIFPLSDREPVRKNLDRTILLLDSLRFFWRDKTRLTIYIVVPDDEISKISVALSCYLLNPVIDVQIITESTVCPKISSLGREYGIAKQMLIKLSSNKIAESDYFLTLDSDVFLCKTVNVNKLLPSNRALTEYLVPSSPAWFANSAKVLGISPSDIDLNILRIFVTPQVLSGNILSFLQKFIEMLHKQNWLDVLIKNFHKEDNSYWTEYTLYDIFSRTNNQLFNYHLSKRLHGEPLHCMEQSLWLPEHAITWNPSRAFSGESPGYFMVLQSILAHSVDFESMSHKLVADAKAAWPGFGNDR